MKRLKIVLALVFAVSMLGSLSACDMSSSTDYTIYGMTFTVDDSFSKLSGDEAVAKAVLATDGYDYDQTSDTVEDVSAEDIEEYKKDSLALMYFENSDGDKIVVDVEPAYNTLKDLKEVDGVKAGDEGIEYRKLQDGTEYILAEDESSKGNIYQEAYVVYGGLSYDLSCTDAEADEDGKTVLEKLIDTVVLESASLKKKTHECKDISYKVNENYIEQDNSDSIYEVEQEYAFVYNDDYGVLTVGVLPESDAYTLDYFTEALKDSTTDDSNEKVTSGIGDINVYKGTNEDGVDDAIAAFEVNGQIYMLTVAGSYDYNEFKDVVSSVTATDE